MPTLYCPTCGYNLTGLTRNVCPECGSPFDPFVLEQGHGVSKWFLAVVIAQIIFVPAVMAVVYALLLFVSVFVRNDYNHLPYEPVAMIIVGVIVFGHGVFLGIALAGKPGSLSSNPRETSDVYIVYLCAAFFGFLEILLTAFYVGGSCAMM